jgi:hypothetical protein
VHPRLPFDQAAYLATIENPRKLEVRLLLYSHGGIEMEPSRAIPRAAENARIYGRMILEAIRRGDPRADIVQRFGDDVSRRFGLILEQEGLEMAVSG